MYDLQCMIPTFWLLFKNKYPPPRARLYFSFSVGIEMPLPGWTDRFAEWRTTKSSRCSKSVMMCWKNCPAKVRVVNGSYFGLFICTHCHHIFETTSCNDECLNSKPFHIIIIIIHHNYWIYMLISRTIDGFVLKNKH